MGKQILKQRDMRAVFPFFLPKSWVVKLPIWAWRAVEHPPAKLT